MKVLLVSPLPPPVGGIASWTVDYMKYCEDNGIDISLINSAVKGSRAGNVNKVSLSEELKRCGDTLKEIKIALKKEKFDVLHYCASCSKVGLIRDYVLLKSLNFPIIYHCHCDLATVINNSVSEFFFKAICKKSSYVFALNTPSLKVALKYTDKAEYVPNFAPSIYDGEKQIEEDLKKILYVGRVTKEKGIRELIYAAEKLPDKDFYIVGPLDDKDIVFPEVDNIKILGRKEHNEAIEIMKQSDVLVLPSYFEGFPLSVLEGMCCGLPIIATDVGAIGDMIGDGGGIVIEKENAEQLIEAIKTVEDKKLRSDMSVKNTEKVRNNYLIDTVVDKMLGIYKKSAI